MANRRFVLPKQWEDWCSWALGIWLLISPWVLRFDFDATAMANTVIVGFLVIRTEVVELTIFRVWEEWVNVALGVWLVASPWALGIELSAPKMNLVIVGVLIVALALHEMRKLRRKPAP